MFDPNEHKITARAVFVRDMSYQIVLDVFTDEGVRCFAQTGHMEWTEYPEGGQIPQKSPVDLSIVIKRFLDSTGINKKLIEESGDE